MDGYGTQEAADVLDISAARVRALVRAGVVTPARGPRNAFRFGFRDLVLLRVAASLMEAGISPRRVVRSLAELRRRLPGGRALSELRIVADGDRILVDDGSAPFEADTGQFVLDFRVAELSARVRPLKPTGAAPESREADAWYAAAVELEDRDPAAAQDAYERTLALDPAHADALVNLGRLCHEEGRTDDATACYRRALDAHPSHATASYNLGVALEDQRRWKEAAAAYGRAIEIQPALADAHFNLATVLERMGDRQAALRALRRYRDLTGSPAAR